MRCMSRCFINCSLPAAEAVKLCLLFNFPLFASLYILYLVHHTGGSMDLSLFLSSSDKTSVFVWWQRVRSPVFVYTGQIHGELSLALSVSNELQPYDWQTGYRPGVSCWATRRAAACVCVCVCDWLDTCLMKQMHTHTRSSVCVCVCIVVLESYLGPRCRDGVC